MLFHPFEERFRLPAFLVRHSYLGGVEIHIVGQEDEFLFGFAIMIFYTPELFGIVFFRVMSFKSAYLVLFDPFGPVRRRGVRSS